MNEKVLNIQFILFRRRNGQFKLAACRGENKGCQKMRQKPKKPCEDCVICEDETETIGQVLDRINRGEA